MSTLRTPKAAKDLLLPECPIPRPGDEVLWYSDAVPFSGRLVGHGPGGCPHVIRESSYPSSLDSFDLVRLADCNVRRYPAWMYLPPQGAIYAATGEEQAAFQALLDERIPPGPSYSELITEIWSRGFEIFVVGGTVRDVLAGKPTHDVDLVTTMPLNRATTLLQAMYRHKPRISEKNGYVRLGGQPRWGDPFIDLKMFSLAVPGSEAAIFGASFERDIGHRDFSFNSIYYDPVNHALIDPCGRGITDAVNGKLHLVCDRTLRSPMQRAQIAIRFIKFQIRGFTAYEETSTQIFEFYLPDLNAMDGAERLRYMKAQVINKSPPEQREDSLDKFREKMIEIGAEAIWKKLFEPLKRDILS